MSLSTWSGLSAICWRRGVLVCASSSVKTSEHDCFAERFRQDMDFKTISRNTPRYSHGSLGHCESAIKEVEKHIRATLFQMYLDYNCNSEKFPAELNIFPGWSAMLRGYSHGTQSKLMGERHSPKWWARTITEKLRNSLKWFWFRIPAKQPKLGEQWKEAHWVGKSERSDEHLLAIRGSTFSARAIQENHVRNSGIWTVSKQCWCAFGN